MKVALLMTGSIDMQNATQILKAFKLLDPDACIYMTDSAANIYGHTNNLSQIQIDFMCYTFDKQCKDFIADGQTKCSYIVSNCDVCIVCPCNFNTIGKIVHGISDNFVTQVISTFLGTSKPVYIVESVERLHQTNPFYVKNKNELMKYNTIHFKNQKYDVKDAIFGPIVEIINELKQVQKEIEKESL